LYDKVCCNRRKGSAQNRSYDGWTWSSGSDTTYFYAVQNTGANSPWSTSQPDNAGGSQGCTTFWVSQNFRMDDCACGATQAYACCSHPPPSATASATATATSSLTRGVSASVSPIGTATSSATATTSASVYIPVDATVDVSGLVGGLVAAIVVGGLAGAAFLVVWPAYALWRRRQRTLRGGALRSSQRMVNQMKRDASARTIVSARGELATLNPVGAALQLAAAVRGAPPPPPPEDDDYPPPPPPPPPMQKGGSASRVMSKPSAARRASASGGLDV